MTSSCSATSISGPTGPPASMNTPLPPTRSQTRYVFERYCSFIERSTIIAAHARTSDDSGARLGRVELIHTCYRIGEIDRSVAFYEALGFEELRRMPIRQEAINVFMGLPGDGPRLELTYNFGVDHYEMGTGYNHIALRVAISTGRSPGSPSRESTPRSRRTRSARAAPACASCAIPTATGSS